MRTTLTQYPSLAKIDNAVRISWPEHAPFLARRFLDSEDPTFLTAEEMASMVLRIVGDELPEYVLSYRWLCEEFVNEDLHFRRTGAYRRSSFEQVYREIYSQSDYMRNYLRGLLMTQVLWANQTASFHFYVEKFLPYVKADADYLEIGPGHGLLMNFAARSPRVRTITGWDVSESSLEMTRHALAVAGMAHPVALALHNILQEPTVRGAYDAVAISEVMEHLDRPSAALNTVFEALRPGGVAFFNVPINSPAPDHIFNWNSVQEVESMIRACGFSITDSLAVPATGYTLDKAIRRKVTINTLIVAQRP